MFGKGIIVRKYEMNQVIKVRVELTANHMGYFELQIELKSTPSKQAIKFVIN